MCWPRGHSVQVERTLQTLSEVLREREVPFEAFDTLLAVPIASNTSMVLLSPFQRFGLSQQLLSNNVLAEGVSASRLLGLSAVDARVCVRVCMLNRSHTEWPGLEGTSRIMELQPPCHRQGHQPPHLILNQAAQGPIQPGLEHLQGWTGHS